MNGIFELEMNDKWVEVGNETRQRIDLMSRRHACH